MIDPLILLLTDINDEEHQLRVQKRPNYDAQKFICTNATTSAVSAVNSKDLHTNNSNASPGIDTAHQITKDPELDAEPESSFSSYLALGHTNSTLLCSVSEKAITTKNGSSKTILSDLFRLENQEKQILEEE
jgi:hypothetical protein